jgi:phosphoribosylglycinamide formyltransferase
VKFHQKYPGTNLQALIDALDTPALPKTRIALVLANRKAAYGLTRAAEANPQIPTSYIALKTYLTANPGQTREDYDEAIAARVAELEPDLVVLAGWMHVLSPRYLDILAGKAAYTSSSGEQRTVVRPIETINLHPALPGAFDGAHAIERAYEAFQKGEVQGSGVMVHRVVKEVDAGAPVLVREVEIKKGESIEEFEKRLHEVEWRTIVAATAKVLDEVKPVA